MRHLMGTLAVLSVVFSGTALAQAKGAPAAGGETAMMGPGGASIWVSPIGMAFGSINATAEFKVGDTFSIGPSVAYSSYSSGSKEATSFGFGASATLYLGHNAFSDGWFL